MGLPKINEDVKYVKTKLPSGKNIGIRGWKVKDEKGLLFALETEENVADTKIKHIIDFLGNCVDDKERFKTVSENDIKRICLEVRKLSKGESIEYTQACPHCGFKFDDSVNLTKEQTVKEFDITPVTVNDRIIVTFKDLDWKKAEALYAKYEKTPTTYSLYYIIHSIDSFTIDGTTYTDFTAEEAEEYIDGLDSNDLKKLYEEFEKKASTCELKRNVKCLKCKENFDINFGDLLSFLVL
jgi:hypothetical protein